MNQQIPRNRIPQLSDGSIKPERLMLIIACFVVLGACGVVMSSFFRSPEQRQAEEKIPVLYQYDPEKVRNQD